MFLVKRLKLPHININEVINCMQLVRTYYSEMEVGSIAVLGMSAGVKAFNRRKKMAKILPKITS